MSESLSHLHLKDALFTLPSQGVPYPKTMPLLPGGAVRIRPMLGADQKVFTSAGADPHQLYYNLLSKIVVEPAVDANQWLMSDVNAILFAMRILSFGDTLLVRYRCPGCAAVEDIPVAFTALEVRYAQDLDADLTKPQMVNTTTIGEHSYTFHLPRLQDEQTVSVAIETSRRKVSRRPALRRPGPEMIATDPGQDDEVSGSAADRALYLLAALIDAVDEVGQQSIYHMVDRLRAMPMAELYELQDAVGAADTGLQPFAPFRCRRCQWEDEVLVQIGPEFFRPTPKRPQHVAR